MMTPSEMLETEIEMALAKYLGCVYPLPTAEWSTIAGLFAGAVEATQVTNDEDGYSCVAERAKSLVYNLGELVIAMSAVVE